MTDPGDMAPTGTDVAILWPAPDVRARWERLLALLEAQPGERVLDVGCGRGQALSWLAGRAGSAVGVESHLPAATEAGMALRAAGRPAVVLGADAQALPFADDAFDAVLCVNVLEAVPDRPRALREMRRVLKPGGRAVVAHDDYESMVYAANDRDLCRRAVAAYSRATFASYAASDGQMGRRLWGIFRGAGFREPQVSVLPLVNTEYREGLLGWVHSRFGARLVAGVSDLTEDELEHWRADLEECSARGEYLYSLNLYVCTGTK